jgi:hypothetical protein
VVTAARAVNMSAKSACALRRRPGAEGFAVAWDGVRADLARIAFDRAVNGTVEPVFRGHRQIGARRVHHDRLLITTLRSLQARYRDLWRWRDAH